VIHASSSSGGDGGRRERVENPSSKCYSCLLSVRVTYLTRSESKADKLLTLRHAVRHVYGIGYEARYEVIAACSTCSMVHNLDRSS
jgi:hypothetical protein